MKRKKTHYVVWIGRETGIFTNWPDCQKQIIGFPSSRFKGFYSKGEADKALKMGIPRKSESERQKMTPRVQLIKDVGIDQLVDYISYHFNKKEHKIIKSRI